MIKSISEFLNWFEGLNRRTVRDVSSLPKEAETYQPPATDGEDSWPIAVLIQHMIVSRLYFASAYMDQGWVWDPFEGSLSSRKSWGPALDESASALVEKLANTPGEWLSRKIELIGDDERSISGWRVLMMMAEHEVHHRSQIDTYSGINGWKPPHIFDRTAEWVASQREEQVRRKR